MNFYSVAKECGASSSSWHDFFSLVASEKHNLNGIMSKRFWCHREFSGGISLFSSRGIISKTRQARQIFCLNSSVADVIVDYVKESASWRWAAQSFLQYFSRNWKVFLDKILLNETHRIWLESIQHSGWVFEDKMPITINFESLEERVNLFSQLSRQNFPFPHIFRKRKNLFWLFPFRWMFSVRSQLERNEQLRFVSTQNIVNQLLQFFFRQTFFLKFLNSAGEEKALTNVLTSSLEAIIVRFHLIKLWINFCVESRGIITLITINSSIVESGMMESKLYSPSPFS